MHVRNEDRADAAEIDPRLHDLRGHAHPGIDHIGLAVDDQGIGRIGSRAADAGAALRTQQDQLCALAVRLHGWIDGRRLHRLRTVSSEKSRR